MIASLVRALLGITPNDHHGIVTKAWIEYSVDTYWTTHDIITGIGSLDRIGAKWQREHGNVGLDCIGRYTGPKLPGQHLGESDVPFMEGYRSNPGRVVYFNGAEPVHG